ncbi:hypothetical protein RZS08_06850, partial [Arthrospira platensis SPKY1]|nr:hypothetical protein [Arthrospira platensis SPKY1]
MPSSPITSEIDFPSYSILVDGTEIKSFYQVVSVSVFRKMHRLATAHIQLVDGDPHEGTFEISESADFAPGKEVEIKLGYNSTQESVFKGVIVSHGIKVRAYSNRVRSVLDIQC